VPMRRAGCRPRVIHRFAGARGLLGAAPEGI
jgi:hypothetical protein